MAKHYGGQVMGAIADHPNMARGAAALGGVAALGGLAHHFLGNNDPAPPAAAPGATPMKAAMDLDKFAEQLPPELKAVLSQPGGFGKLAAAVYSLPDMDDRTLFEHIGTKLALANLEKQTIDKGLAALQQVASWGE
jgi:hypothetical protein